MSGAPHAIRGVRVEAARDTRAFRRLLNTRDFLYTLSIYPKHATAIARAGIKVILDLYAPVAFECLEAYPEMPTDLLDRIHRHKTWWTTKQIRMAELLVVANARQADFWIGVANQLDRLNAATIRRDPTLANMIMEIPIGVPPGTPVAHGHPVRMKLGLSPTDFIFMWSSKILAWQDPVVLMDAMKLLQQSDPTIKVVFLGVGDAAAEGKASWLDASALRTRQARQLAAEAGLTNATVFFIDERINYVDLGRYYRDCDAAVATYPDTLETRMCLGTRLADYVWAELPMAVTGRTLQRQFVDENGIGYCTPPGNARALADAMSRIKQQVRNGGWNPASFATTKERHSWQALTAPLAEWCRQNKSHRVRRTTGAYAAVSAIRFLFGEYLIRRALSRR
jgi:glycosyltransferase involved in cell wall biosynthesis